MFFYQETKQISNKFEIEKLFVYNLSDFSRDRLAQMVKRLLRKNFVWGDPSSIQRQDFFRLQKSINFSLKDKLLRQASISRLTRSLQKSGWSRNLQQQNTVVKSLTICEGERSPNKLVLIGPMMLDRMSSYTLLHYSTNLHCNSLKYQSYLLNHTAEYKDVD